MHFTKPWHAVGNYIQLVFEHFYLVFNYFIFPYFYILNIFEHGWLGSRVVSVLDPGAVEPGFKSQPRRCRVTVLGKLFTPVVPLFTKQRNW